MDWLGVLINWNLFIGLFEHTRLVNDVIKDNTFFAEIEFLITGDYKFLYRELMISYDLY